MLECEILIAGAAGGPEQRAGDAAGGGRAPAGVQGCRACLAALHRRGAAECADATAGRLLHLRCQGLAGLLQRKPVCAPRVWVMPYLLK